MLKGARKVGRFWRSRRRRGVRCGVEPFEPRVMLASIQGVLWNDLNGDNVRGGNEPALVGWTVYLDRDHDNRLDTDEARLVTGGDGSYSFNNLAAGNYLVGIVPKANWVQTYPAAAAAGGGAAAGAPALAAGAGAGGLSDAVGAAIRREAGRSVAGQADGATEWVIGLAPGARVASVVSKTGASGATATGVMADTYVLRFPETVAGAAAAARLSGTRGLSFFYALVGRARPGRSLPDDPLFPAQWSLRNTGQTGGLAGADANLPAAWDLGYLGAGVTVAVVDDGLQRTHPDLDDNYDPSNSWDFYSGDGNPSPNVSRDDFHGTGVAGIIGARGDNGVGISGAAPRVSLAGIRLTSGNTTDVQEAGALGFRRNSIDVYNNSWGPSDDGAHVEAPGPLTLAALRDGALNGRDGRGNVFVWAAGNGGEEGDDVNYDGYANSRYVIAATAIDDFGRSPSYAENGAPILVSAYSDGDGAASGIVTTDYSGPQGWSSNDYMTDFGGTSAAAPLVSGVVALMLDANPNLTWRDVKHILVNTARENDAGHADWVTNGAGHRVNHDYGFGAVDAWAAVSAAAGWANVAPEQQFSSAVVSVNRAIPDAGAAVSSTIAVGSLLKVETVEVVFSSTIGRRGDLEVVLTSPDGTRSVLAKKHDDTNADYSEWVFSSVRHWDEIARGNWTLTVRDRQGGGAAGTFGSWKLNLYGTPVVGQQYVSLASETSTVVGTNFSARPVAGARVSGAGFTFQVGRQTVAFTFDRDVSGGIGADALELVNQTTGQAVSPGAMQFQYGPASRTAVWRLGGLAGGVLPDGNYTARLRAEKVTVASGATLDGNGDGFGGDDYVLGFFQLQGDANRDRAVNHADFKILYANFGKGGSKAFEHGDFSGDGTVDFTDFMTLERSFGHAVAAPVDVAGESAPVRTVPARGAYAPPRAAVFSTEPVRAVAAPPRRVIWDLA